MIFVALQRPSDTTTMFLAGPCGSQFVFYDWIRNLACKLDPRRYAIVVKKHPLESVIPDLGPVLIARDDCHIHDLILAADKVVVINSGVGLLSVTFGVPTITCGKSYYTHNGLAVQAGSPEELLILCQSPLQVDLEKRDRFVHYLVFKFYSFGVARLKPEKRKTEVFVALQKEYFGGLSEELLTKKLFLATFQNLLPVMLCSFLPLEAAFLMPVVSPPRRLQ